MRLERERADAERVIARSPASLAPALALVTAILERDPEHAPAVADLEPCMGYAHAVEERGLPPYEGPMPERQGWPTPEDVELEEAYVRSRADVAARLELCLCVLGTFVALYARDAAPAPDLAEDIARERARHLAHREEERAERVAELERERTRARRALEVPRPHAGARAYLESVESALARVRALDAETLCTDRCALA